MRCCAVEWCATRPTIRLGHPNGLQVAGAVDRVEPGVAQRDGVADVVQPYRRQQDIVIAARLDRVATCSAYRYPNRVPPALRQMNQQPLRDVTGAVDIPVGLRTPVMPSW